MKNSISPSYIVVLVVMLQVNTISSQFVTTVDPWTPLTQIPLSGDPRIECDSDQIRLVFDLINPFNGILYPKNSYNHGETNCSLTGNGRSSLNYVIPLYGCGTISIQQEDGSINFRNVIILQNHNMLVTSSDRAYHIDCHYPLQEKIVSSNTNISMITTIGVLTGIPELPEPIMTIHVGKTPDGPLISGFVSLGSFLTLKIRLMDESVYGFTVHTCYARDGLNWGEQLLIDANGCPVNSGVFGPFQYDNINSITGAPSNGITRAFVMFASHKFPTSNSVYYECIVKLCPKSSCRIPSCNGQRLAAEITATTIEPTVWTTTEGGFEENEVAALRELENVTLSTILANTTLLPFIPTNLTSGSPTATTFTPTTLPIAIETATTTNFINVSEASFLTTSTGGRVRRSARVGRDVSGGAGGDRAEQEMRVKGSVIILDDAEEDKSLTTEEGFKHPDEMTRGRKYGKVDGKNSKDSNEGSSMGSEPQRRKHQHTPHYKFSDESPSYGTYEDRKFTMGSVTSGNEQNSQQNFDIMAREMARAHSGNREFCMSTAVFSVGIAIFVCIFLAAITITSVLCLKTKKGLTSSYKKGCHDSYVDPTYYPRYEHRGTHTDSTLSPSSGSMLSPVGGGGSSFNKSSTSSSPAISPTSNRGSGSKGIRASDPAINSTSLNNAFQQHLPQGTFITKTPASYTNSGFNGPRHYR